MSAAAISLDVAASAYTSLPSQLGKKLSHLTEDELVTKLFVLWKESIHFLNELAPHGYRILNVEFVGKPDDWKCGVTFKLMVCAADASRINSEWNTDHGKEEPPGEQHA